MGSDNIVMLNANKLRKLADIILIREEALMVWMKSEPERAAYLDNCNNSREGVKALLRNSEDLVQNHINSKNDLKEIVENIHKYIIYTLNMSMQCIRNCSVRLTCIDKIKAHFADLVKAVRELEPGNVAATRRLAEEVTLYRDFMWEYANSCRSASAQSLSRAFSQVLKQQGLTFSELVNKKKSNLGLKAEFEKLEDVDKLRVYQSIIDESGRVKVPMMEKITASMGVAVLVVTSALIVFDIFVAEHKVEAVVRNAFNVASEVGAFAVQLATEGALISYAAFEGASILVVAAAGFIAGALAGLIFMAVSGALVDMIFGSGGNVQPQLDGMKFCKLEFPDGMAIANELSHEVD